MDIIHRTDEALLDAASRTNGMLRDLLGVDQWKGARVLAHVYLALLICSQLAMTHERGFAWGNMLILGTWIWHYATTVSGIDRYSRSANGSSMARIVERPFPQHLSLHAGRTGTRRRMRRRTSLGPTDAGRMERHHPRALSQGGQDATSSPS